MNEPAIFEVILAGRQVRFVRPGASLTVPVIMNDLLAALGIPASDHLKFINATPGPAIKVMIADAVLWAMSFDTASRIVERLASPAEHDKFIRAFEAAYAGWVREQRQ